MTTYDPLTNRTAFPTGLGFPARPVDYIGSSLYGVLTNDDLYVSTDHGTSWTYVCAIPGTVTAAQVRRLIATSDSEVLLGANGGVWKSSGWGTSSVSWNQELDVTVGATLPTAALLEWGFDGDGTNFIATHYSQADRSDSRYAWISTDSGANWSQVWDSETDAPSADPTDSHIHGACYDQWDDKWYICEGHGDSLGVYVSANDGSTWTEVEDNGLNTSAGTATPTVCVATDDGIVFGSDNGNDGIWTLERGNESAGLVHAWEWESAYTSLNGFANRGVRDPVTGIVYVGFQSDRSDLGAVIGASDGVTAAGVWTDEAYEGEYSNLVAYDGHVSGASSRDSVNVFFSRTPTKGASMSGGYWYTDGSNGTAATAPDLAAYDTAGDIDVRLDVAPDTYTGTFYLMSRYNSGFLWRLGTANGVQNGRIYDSGSTVENLTGVAIPANLLVSAGDRIHLRWQIDFGGNVTFYGRDVATAAANDLSSDSNWTQLDQDALTNTDLKQGADYIAVAAQGGADTGGQAGYYYRAMFIHGTSYASGTVQFDADFTSLTPAEVAAGAFTESSANAATVTFQGSGWSAVAGAKKSFTKLFPILSR